MVKKRSSEYGSGSLKCEADTSDKTKAIYTDYSNTEGEYLWKGIKSAPDYDDTDSEGIINNGTFTINSYNDGI